MNVGDVRKATEGLPDEAQIHLYVYYDEDDDSDKHPYLSLAGFHRKDHSLAIAVEYHGTIDDEDWEEDE